MESPSTTKANEMSTTDPDQESRMEEDEKNGKGGVGDSTTAALNPTMTTTDNDNSASVAAVPSATSAAATSNAELPKQEETKSLSKNQLKKIKKWERKMEVKKRRKQQEKDAKRAKAQAQGRDLEQERRDMEARTASGEGKRKRQEEWIKKMIQAQHSFQVCIDCHFESDMQPREINSLAQQLRYCYASNRRSPLPCYLAATSLGKGGGETLGHLKHVSGFEEWSGYNFVCASESLEVHYATAATTTQPPKSLVYLTSDSDTVLETLDPNTVYIIGGIVDRNRLKKAALHRAQSLGIATAKLPLDEHLEAMESTRVLTVNHVFDILLQFKQHGDWKMALQKVLPDRKRAKFASQDDKEEKEKEATKEQDKPSSET